MISRGHEVWDCAKSSVTVCGSILVLVSSSFPRTVAPCLTALGPYGLFIFFFLPALVIYEGFVRAVAVRSEYKDGSYQAPMCSKVVRCQSGLFVLRLQVGSCSFLFVDSWFKTKWCVMLSE